MGSLHYFMSHSKTNRLYGKPWLSIPFNFILRVDEFLKLTVKQHLSQEKHV